ncbi:TDT family transporter [Rhizobium gallicum]|uniref:TDT family transporter n=1 Tax=Rhizobium gallicum TaxID=56730 RepID=UPI001EF85D54|nr:TDT family transporter [Rhizobium gallicum]ULJ75800.1 TDT family transporter [Rhizobium gallicum]
MARIISFDSRLAEGRHRPSHQGQIVRHFTPNWFATTMGTGILSIGLAQIPSQPLLFLVGQALWLFNILIFSLCCALYLTRWMFYPHEAAKIFQHPVASMFFGCIPMGLATIINGFLIYGPSHLGGHLTTLIAISLWWFDVALSVVCGLVVPFMMFTRQSHTIETMTAVWLLPIVACEVASVSGGLLLPHIDVSTAELAVMTVSCVLWACSVPLAMSILVILFLRLVLHKLPHVGMAATSWLALGPIGTGALSLFVMSQNAPEVLAANGLGSMATAIAGASFLGGLLLWGYGTWWLAIALMITLRYLKDGIPYNIGWWGYTFPLGVYAVATARLAAIVPLAPLGWMASILVGALALVWIIVALRTLSGIADRSLFVAPCIANDREITASQMDNFSK